MGVYSVHAFILFLLVMEILNKEVKLKRFEVSYKVFRTTYKATFYGFNLTYHFNKLKRKFAPFNVKVLEVRSTKVDFIPPFNLN